ncbi:MAG: hypothetical protein ACJAQ4_002298 [Cryomorphaceae bacterium]|jgi:hypothetical protein
MLKKSPFPTASLSHFDGSIKTINLWALLPATLEGTIGQYPVRNINKKNRDLESLKKEGPAKDGT